VSTRQTSLLSISCCCQKMKRAAAATTRNAMTRSFARTSSSSSSSVTISDAAVVRSSGLYGNNLSTKMNTMKNNDREDVAKRRRGGSRFSSSSSTTSGFGVADEAMRMGKKTTTTTILYTTTHERLTIERFLSNKEDDDDEEVSVSVAVSDFGFDKIGDVLAIEKKAEKEAPKTFIKNETSLATLKWSGFHRTAADELYHSLWSNVNGVRDLKLPFRVRNVRFNDEMVQEAYKLCVPNANILECKAVGEEVENCSDLMNESEYEKFVDRELEEEENASYKSYP
jgi:hypothetical protein